MMRKRLLILLLVAFCPLLSRAQDTTLVKASKWINDYSMIGVNYGVTFSNMYFSPSMHNRAWVMAPNYISVMYTKHCKMFDTLPYFALTIGAAYGSEGFSFKENAQTGYTQSVDGVSWCSMKTFEIPAMAQIHLDFYPGKLLANAGVYGGWRNSITRRGPSLPEAYENSFREYENQIDYGFEGGVGFGLMFDPIEIHFNCLVRWSWSSMYEPDYKSYYYYNYAYPIDVMATVGIYFQLTKRTGKTNRALRSEARSIVYGTNQDN